MRPHKEPVSVELREQLTVGAVAGVTWNLPPLQRHRRGHGGWHRQRRGHLERVQFCQGRHRGRPYRMADSRAIRWLRPAEGRARL
jgi:hypothetical protein